jgi:signal transduction histidine kinase
MISKAIPKTKLLRLLTLQSVTVVMIAMSIGFYYFNITFTLLCLSVIACNLFIYLLSFRNYERIGFHLLLISHIVIGTLSTFLDVSGYSLMLIFPLAISMAVFFFDTREERLFYFIFNTICALLCIFQLVNPDDSTKGIAKFIVESIICCGLLFSLYYTMQNYMLRIAKYEDQLERNERTISQKNAKLNHYIKTNLQLENFAHLASHELKTPVRNISNFIGLLKKKASQKLNPDEIEHVDYIAHQTTYMYGLINDLLELSSLTHQESTKEGIELLTFVRGIIRDNYQSQSEYISLKFEPQKIMVNKQQFVLVLKNLIDNGLKYVKKGNIPEIIFETERDASQIIIKVSDNGIGIKDELKDNVFLIFKRLHTQSEYEGNGVGLSFCRKIMEKHNGNIWVEDNPKGGSIFKISIPIEE